MRNYEGMRLPPTLDPHTRNELLKVDKFLKQLPAALAKVLEGGNNPRAIISTGGGGGGGSSSGLPDHNHSASGLGGSTLGTPFSLINIYGKVIFAGDTANQITLGDSSVTSFVVQFYESGVLSPTHAVINWGANPNALSDPATTADQLGVAGARLNVYKDSTGQYDVVYGQGFTNGWVLVCDENISYDFFTGGLPSLTPFLRVSWAGNGDMTNYGKVRVRKSTGATVKGTPAIELEETGAGVNYTGFKAPAAITSDHLYTLPAGLPSAASLWTISTAGVIAAVSQVTTRRVWIPAEAWFGFGGASTVQQYATEPDAVPIHILGGTVDTYLGASREIPDDWVSGTVTVKCHWTSSGAAAQNWVPYFYTLQSADGDNVGNAKTAITGPTTSANFAVGILKITTIGTFTPGAAGKHLSMTFGRKAAADANDNYTNNIYFLGVELSYTPSY